MFRVFSCEDKKHNVDNGNVVDNFDYGCHQCW